MMVYILNQEGKPLMPTNRHGKVKHLLREGRAKVVKRTPFTIQLLYATTDCVQPIVLGVDAGSKVIGLSATTEKEELFASEVVLRNDIVELLSIRRQNRRTRRNRLRYRKARFLNRVKSKNKGWLAPSIQHKVDSHLKAIANVYKILPISKIIIETASFDIQKIKNPQISGVDYQQGEQEGFWNVREYALWRDGHECQHCHGKSKDKFLNVHHKESRKTGGDSPGNLVTLCETCHTLHHKGKIELNLTKNKSYRDATFMGIMRWQVYNKLKEIYPNISMTYGYITKNNRITNGIEKTHTADAFCIAGSFKAKRSSVVYFQTFKRRHNRQIHKANFLKGGKKKLNQSPYEVKGFRLFDKVLFQEKECFVFGRRATGYFDLRKLDGTVIHRSASVKNIKLLEKKSTLLIERQVA
ncbi:HNH endonuclease [Tissierella creatinini]|nr:HNH endonuclease [Tissierella creatinini]